MNHTQKFFPGDRVVFTGPYLHNGQVHKFMKFEPGIEYEVQDHSEWIDQWREKTGPHVILLAPTGSGGTSYQWVDEDCLELSLPPVTDEEVEAALKSIATSVKGL